jgi:hypothetical protein
MGKIYQMANIYKANGHKIYQMAIRYTKVLSNIPNGHKIYVATFSNPRPFKYTAIEDHLATQQHFGKKSSLFFVQRFEV